MNSPLDKHMVLDVSSDRLNAMSEQELVDEMEKALDSMTEDDYDPEVISAYLDALDRKAPIPEHPSADMAYSEFLQRMEPLSAISVKQKPATPVNRFGGLRRALRMGLVAALLVSCLFGSMVVAQAAGLDVFGAMARWTESVFSFGEMPTDNSSNHPTDGSGSSIHTNDQNRKHEVAEEYKELQAALSERGLHLRSPKIADDFEIGEPLLYIDPATNNVEFSIAYTRDDDYIIFEVVQNSGVSNKLYEKDDNKVETYLHSGITHYIFNNERSAIGVWNNENLEYSISTNAASVDLKGLIHTTYEE